MIFNFLVGMEGSGHNMTRAFLKYHFERKEVVHEGSWHGLIYSYWDTNRYWSTNKWSNHMSRYQVKDLFRKLINQCKLNGATHLYETHPSFPYLQPRDTLRRPDILEFEEFCEGVVDVKYIITYRNSILATYSNFRRKHSDNLHLLCKMTEDNLIYIERQFSQLDKEKYKILHFEKFLENPEKYLKPISQWWNIDLDDLEKGLKKLKKPHGKNDIPTEHKHILKSFFSEKRLAQWEEFFNQNELCA